jgi:hypothetical protein
MRRLAVTIGVAAALVGSALGAQIIWSDVAAPSAVGAIIWGD